MTKYIEKQAATIDEAVQLALDELQMDRDSVSVEVLEKGKSGFFGIGAVPARVRVSYEESTPESEAKDFVDGLLQRMGIQGEAFLSVKEDGQIILDIRGEDMGAVIGRRGDTLDAIQYLTSLTINRGKKSTSALRLTPRDTAQSARNLSSVWRAKWQVRC